MIARNVLKENVTVQLEDGVNATFSIEHVKLLATARTNTNADTSADEED